MNIGFDLDKVFIDFPPFVPRWVIDKFDKEKENGELLYRIPGNFEQKIRQLSHLPILRHPISTNIKFLQELSHNKTHTLFLVSSRFGFLKKQTEALAKRYNFYTIFKKMYFNFNNKQPHVFKNEVLDTLNLDRYVDDDLSLLKFLENQQKNTQFFWLNSKYNGKIHGNIKGITDIREILS